MNGLPDTKPYILFSTLGMTDPIKNDFDGPFLHIMRHYKPRKAYLFMTKRVSELADKDDRYRTSAKKLCLLEGFSCEIIELRYPHIDNPQQFDIFHPIFEKILIDIHRTNPGSGILINLSSGTPQMKSTCHLLALTMPFPVVPIQVTTPNESENYGSPEYSVESNWENNIDNHPECGPNNRLQVVESENLRYMFLRESAISNIEAYNYSAALSTLSAVEEFVPEHVIHLVRAAQHRKNVDLQNAGIESRRAEYDLFPIKSEQSEDAKVLFEYLLVLGLQQKSGQLMDFVRGISPALSKLFAFLIQEKLGRLLLRDYCRQDPSDRNHWIIKRALIQKNDPGLAAYYDQYFRDGFRDSDLSCATLLPIIAYDCRPGGKYPNNTLLDRAQAMRFVEEKVRNPAAHNIMAVKETQFVDNAGISSEKLLREMQWMFKYIYSQYCPPGMDLWNSYDRMNDHIIASLRKTG